MAKKIFNSKFAIKTSDIMSMSVPELKAYIKHARPYTVQRVRRISLSDYASLSETVELVEGEMEKPGRYGLSSRDLAVAKRNPAAFVSRVTDNALSNDVTPKQLQDTARLISYIARRGESPSQLGRKFGLSKEEIVDWINAQGGKRAAMEIEELTKSAKNMRAIKEWTNREINALMDKYGSDENGIIDIRAYVDKYGDDTDEFYLAVVQRFKEWAAESGIKIK